MVSFVAHILCRLSRFHRKAMRQKGVLCSSVCSDSSKPNLHWPSLKSDRGFSVKTFGTSVSFIINYKSRHLWIQCFTQGYRLLVTSSRSLNYCSIHIPVLVECNKKYRLFCTINNKLVITNLKTVKTMN